MKLHGDQPGRPNTLGRRTLLAGSAVLLGAATRPAILTEGDALGDALDTADFLEPSFHARFDRLPVFRTGLVKQQPPRPLTDPGFQWTAGYIHATRAPGAPSYTPAGKPAPAFSWLSSELAIYPNADAIVAGGVSPFHVEDNSLVITVDRMPASMQPLVPPGFSTTYLSGAITSYPFSQTYGYIEFRGQVPAGRGLWPAFWLMPVDMSWPPENDVMEVLGHEPETLYTTLHSKRLPRGTMDGHPTRTVDLSRAPHDFGVDWGPKRVRYYLDRRLVFSRPTPDDWHKPFYLLANLAVGGPKSWPGPPDPTTPFPACFRIQQIRAWQRAAYAGVHAPPGP